MTHNPMLAAASVAALLAVIAAAPPALAQNDPVAETNRAITRGIDNAAEAINRTFDGRADFRSEAEAYREGSLTVEELIGTRVEGANGQDIATVADVLLTREGRVDSIVLSDGGVLGFGQRRVAVSASQVIPVFENRMLDRVIVETQSDALWRRDAADLSAEALRNRGLVSAGTMTGTPVQDGNGETIASVDDIVLDSNAQAAVAILAVGGFLGVGDRHVALDFNDLQRRSDGDGGLTLIASRTQIAQAPAVGMRNRPDASESRTRRDAGSNADMPVNEENMPSGAARPGQGAPDDDDGGRRDDTNTTGNPTGQSPDDAARR